MVYKIEYSRKTVTHLRSLTARHRSTVLNEVEIQLRHEPGAQTKNRKQMRPNPLASWELRLGDLRIYYDIDEINLIVIILAIGIKKRDQVQIGKEIIKL